MARKVKQIINDGVDKREVGYYSTPEFIAKYLTEEMLRINPNGKYVLDPAVGKEELLYYFYEAGKEIMSVQLVLVAESRRKNLYVDTSKRANSFKVILLF